MGFDEWVSADNFFDLNPVLGRNGIPEKFHGDSSDVTTNEAVEFIRKQSGSLTPFLAVVWFGSPHTPHQALASDKAAYSHLPPADQDYYGEIAAIDRNVGRLRTVLRELKISENTIVWYNSDNGGARGPNSTGNLRGNKGSLWEGGLRVPGIVEWPARIPKPFASDVPCSTLDIYPTLLEATGSMPQQQIQPLDGVSLISIFDQKSDIRTKPIPFWRHAADGSGHAAFLDWPYKLHTNAKSTGKRKGDPSATMPSTLLYDVAQDPNETQNLAKQYPERVVQMTKALDSWKVSVERSFGGADYSNLK